MGAMDLARTDIYLDEAWGAPSCGQTIAVHNVRNPRSASALPRAESARRDGLAVLLAPWSRRASAVVAASCRPLTRSSTASAHWASARGRLCGAGASPISRMRHRLVRASPVHRAPLPHQQNTRHQGNGAPYRSLHAGRRHGVCRWGGTVTSSYPCKWSPQRMRYHDASPTALTCTGTARSPACTASKPRSSRRGSSGRDPSSPPEPERGLLSSALEALASGP